jgi:hypothetical protein
LLYNYYPFEGILPYLVTNKKETKWMFKRERNAWKMKMIKDALDKTL